MARIKDFISLIHKRQAGFTLVEIMVASLLLSIGLATTVSLISSGNRANDSAKRQQSAAAVAQRELERLQDLNYDQLSLTSTPSSSTDPDSPLSRIEGTQFTTETGSAEELVVGGEDAAVAPGPETVSEVSGTAEVYRFITWVDGPSYFGCSENCSSTQDYKRITVVARQSSNTNLGFSKPVVVSTLRIDPDLGPQGTVTQPEDPNPTESHDNFHLYDTPVSSCSSVTYQQPASDHTLHDTTGSCSDSSGSYPDLMGIDVPPNPIEPDLPPLYTYSSDLTGEYSGGIALQRGNSSCDTSGLSKYQQHRWSTTPLSASDYELTGKISFDFWASLVGETGGLGKICLWLYDRDTSGGTPSDTLIASDSYELTNWPATQTNLSFTFSHTPYTLPAGHRLHLVVAASSDSIADLHLAYDHPASPSFLQIKTTTPVTG